MTGDMPKDKYDTTMKELFTDSEEDLIRFFCQIETQVIRQLKICRAAFFPLQWGVRHG
jgi:hypothetical protein